MVAFKDSAAVERAVTFAARNVLRNGDALTLLFIEVRSVAHEDTSETESTPYMAIRLPFSLIAAIALLWQAALLGLHGALRASVHTATAGHKDPVTFPVITDGFSHANP